MPNQLVFFNHFVLIYIRNTSGAEHKTQGPLRDTGKLFIPNK